MGRSQPNQDWLESEAQVADLYEAWEKESLALNKQRKEKRRTKREYFEKSTRGNFHG